MAKTLAKKLLAKFVSPKKKAAPAPKPAAKAGGKAPPRLATPKLAAKVSAPKAPASKILVTKAPTKAIAKSSTPKPMASAKDAGKKGLPTSKAPVLKIAEKAPLAVAKGKADVAPKVPASKITAPKKEVKKDIMISPDPSRSTKDMLKGSKGVIAVAVSKAVAPVPVQKPLTKAPKGKGSRKERGQMAAASRGYDPDGCREIGCESGSTTAGYCRLHYIKNWKKIKRKELILREKKLNQYIEELVSKYPDKYLESIRQDLADEKAFSKVIYDLELDESLDDLDSDEESDDNIIENIRRDFDDEGDF